MGIGNFKRKLRKAQTDVFFFQESKKIHHTGTEAPSQHWFQKSQALVRRAADHRRVQYRSRSLEKHIFVGGGECR